MVMESSTRGVWIFCPIHQSSAIHGRLSDQREIPHFGTDGHPEDDQSSLCRHLSVRDQNWTVMCAPGSFPLTKFVKITRNEEMDLLAGTVCSVK